MGSVTLKIGEGTARFKPASFCSSAANILMLISVLITNLFALYAFTSPKHNQLHHHLHNHHKNMSLISEHVSLILKEINFSQKKLAQVEKEVLGFQNIDLSKPNIPNELKTFLIHYPLPLGKDSRSGITEMTASIGHLCANSVDLLSQYMNYKVGSACPDDLSLTQKLISRNCEPLPRRRCFARSVPKQVLSHFPNSLWKPVNSKSVSWNGFSCKSFECLSGKKVSEDCVGCFDLVNGTEKQRWVKSKSKNEFTIDEILALGNKNLRIGFDLGGGSGSFAARMAEKNVTIITSALNSLAPFNEFIAARGLLPLHLASEQRFPFYDGIFDLVHSGSSLGDGSKQEKLEFLLFDIDRVLRVGGLLWLDNFHCVNEERKKALTRLIERFGYKKLRWVVGEKSGRVHLSAVLQKPVRR